MPFFRIRWLTFLVGSGFAAESLSETGPSDGLALSFSIAARMSFFEGRFMH